MGLACACCYVFVSTIELGSAGITFYCRLRAKLSRVVKCQLYFIDVNLINYAA